MTKTWRRVAVTGAAGFLGRAVVRHFLAQGASVLAMGRHTADLVQRFSEMTSSLMASDINLPDERLSVLLRDFQPELLIHAAGPTAVADSMTFPRKDFEAATLVTFDVLDALRQTAPQCRFINLSSAAVYGNPYSLPVPESAHPSPTSPYGYHKHFSEQVAQEFHKLYGIPTLSCRIFSAYGEGLKRQVIWDICRKANMPGPLQLRGTGDETRDFIHVTDVVKAIDLLAGHAPFEGEKYNLASGQASSIRQVAETLAAALGVQKELSFDGAHPSYAPVHWEADITKIRQLGFSPDVSLTDGLARYARWFLTQPAEVLS